MMSLYITRIRGVVGAMALFATSFFGTLVFLVPVVPLAFIPRFHTVFRYYTDFFITSWLTFAIAVMRIFHGVNIVAHGDHLLNVDKAIIMMNHRTRLDWYYFWSPVLADGCLFDLKIALKRTLARIPGAGWAQQLASFLFLNRKADVDLPRIASYMKYLASYRERPFKLLVFPEGTDYCPNSKIRSDAFADKSSLPRYEYVLHPRITGVEFAFNTLTELNSLDAVYDVTIAYEGPFPSSEMAVVAGDLPTNVHFYIKRYPVSDVIATGSSKFWQQKWEEKEKFLKEFYVQGDKFHDLRGGRSEGTFATAVEYAALLLWTFFLYIVFIHIVPTYWLVIVFETVGLIFWSEFTTNSIDGTIIEAGHKRK